MSSEELANVDDLWGGRDCVAYRVQGSETCDKL